MPPTLHFHPVSTTSRAVTFFAADRGIALDLRVVDLFAGEHLGAAFSAINPNQLVPVLDDGSFRLTESAAILRYLAARFAPEAHGATPRERARTDELLDWFNTGLMREFAYGLVYPQVFPHHRRDDPRVHAGVLAWSAPRAARLLGILDEWLIGPRHAFLQGGEAPTLADYFGHAVVSAGELVGHDLAPYPNVARWIAALQARPGWRLSHAEFRRLVVATAPQRMARAGAVAEEALA